MSQSQSVFSIMKHKTFRAIFSCIHDPSPPPIYVDFDRLRLDKYDLNKRRFSYHLPRSTVVLKPAASDSFQSQPAEFVPTKSSRLKFGSDFSRHRSGIQLPSNGNSPIREFTELPETDALGMEQAWRSSRRLTCYSARCVCSATILFAHFAFSLRSWRDRNN